MPIVTIQVTREGTKPESVSVTAQEKAALINGATDLLSRYWTSRPRAPS